MTFYIASGLQNAALVHQFIRAFDATGHTCTYDWTPNTSDPEAEEPEQLMEIARCEGRGVVDADVVAVLLPGGRGTHVELGIALGRGKKTVLLCARSERELTESGVMCSFYTLPCIQTVIGEPSAWWHAIAEALGIQVVKGAGLKQGETAHHAT